jgi:prolyl 4-hydroxylase
MAEDAVTAAVSAIPAPAPAPAPEPAPAPVPAVAQSTPPIGAGQDARAFSEQLAQTPNAFATSDREVSMLFALAAPRVILFGGLLAPEECDQLIELSRGKLARSSVVNAATGSYDVHPHRTSAGTHFARGENELIRRIEARISELVEIPVERGEPLQILHYQPGGEYKPHFDYFDPAQPGNEAVLKHGGQRVATLVMYLNDVEAGGSTVFPEVGLDVLPRRGHAVYFAYTTEEGQLDKRSLHGGSPVGAGEKWIATKWFRQRDYGGPGA